LDHNSSGTITAECVQKPDKFQLAPFWKPHDARSTHSSSTEKADVQLKIMMLPFHESIHPVPVCMLRKAQIKA
jgi:hypothetical protein